MSSVPVYQNFINGRFTPSSAHIDVLNPATGALLSKVPAATAEDVDQALAAARAAQQDWARKPAVERAGHLRRIAAKLRENVAHLARTITLEQGKISSLAEVEVNFTADYLDYMAEWARRIEGEIITSDRPNENIFLFRKPLGVVAGILPWNFPFFLIARKMAPALLTGNTIVIKPSEETPNNCFEFARLVAETDLPAGVFNVVCGDGQVGGALTAHKGVDMISFTGSVATGSRIWNWRSRPSVIRGSSTAARCATAPSGCMCNAASPTSLSSASARRWPPPATATHWPRPMWRWAR